MPALSLGELQRVAVGSLPCAWQRQLVKALVVYLQNDALQHAPARASAAGDLAEGVWRALWQGWI